MARIDHQRNGLDPRAAKQSGELFADNHAAQCFAAIGSADQCRVCRDNRAVGLEVALVVRNVDPGAVPTEIDQDVVGGRGILDEQLLELIENGAAGRGAVSQFDHGLVAQPVGDALHHVHVEPDPRQIVAFERHELAHPDQHRRILGKDRSRHCGQGKDGQADSR